MIYLQRKKGGKLVKNKIKTTSFWLGLSSAIVVLVGAISKLFGVNISSSVVEDIVLSICALLICLGFVNKKTESGEACKKDELLDEVLKENKNEDEK